MRIRRLAAADVPAYRVLWLRALREHPQAFTSSHEEDAAQPPEAGVASLVLTVTQGNAPAQRLYEAAGFRCFGVEPDAVRTGGRSWAKNHMHLDLSQAPP